MYIYIFLNYSHLLSFCASFPLLYISLHSHCNDNIVNRSVMDDINQFAQDVSFIISNLLICIFSIYCHRSIKINIERKKREIQLFYEKVKHIPKYLSQKELFSMEMVAKSNIVFHKNVLHLIDYLIIQFVSIYSDNRFS